MKQYGCSDVAVTSGSWTRLFVPCLTHHQRLETVTSCVALTPILHPRPPVPDWRTAARERRAANAPGHHTRVKSSGAATDQPALMPHNGFLSWRRRR